MGLLPVRTLDDLALEIDRASDLGDETLLRQLGRNCVSQLDSATGEDRVRLLYFLSNTYSAIVSIKRGDSDYVWNWGQSDGVQNILSLRRAIREPSFESISPIVACQIQTNLANRLSNLGRPVAANHVWLQVLNREPYFAKALASRAQCISHFSRLLYDDGHIPLLLKEARDIFDSALSENAFWDGDDRETYARNLVEERNSIADILIRYQFDEGFDTNQWSLGATEEERSYRHWCLHNRLFINPLNEAYTDSVAATDVLHLPSHTYRIGDVPRFPSYFNLMKQEYVSARYRLYRTIHNVDPEFVMRDVFMLEDGEGQELGYYTEDLRSAFRSAYSIFDKIGLFLNDYFQIGSQPRNVSFRKIWYDQRRGGGLEVRDIFKERQNWPLRGLFYLSKDLFDSDFQETAEPDAANLSVLRNQVEHRFLSFQFIATGQSTATHQFVSIDEFESKTLSLLRLAREALIYLSLAMHREEESRANDATRKKMLDIPIMFCPKDSFNRR